MLAPGTAEVAGRPEAGELRGALHPHPVVAEEPLGLRDAEQAVVDEDPVLLDVRPRRLRPQPGDEAVVRGAGPPVEATCPGEQDRIASASGTVATRAKLPARTSSLRSRISAGE